MKFIHLSLTSIALGFVLSSAQSAPITWSSATNISGDTNVVTTGSLVRAFNLGTTGVQSTTVNGVTFDPFAVPNDLGTGSVTNGNFTLGFRGGREANNTIFGSSSAPFSSLSSSYKSLLESGAGDGVFNTSARLTLTISGLSSGTAYSFQWWTNDSGKNLPDGTTTATSGSSVVLDFNTTNTGGGLGQFATGTFTADAATQVITFTTSSEVALLNGFQLRAVPEPSTWAAMLIGAASLLAFRRRKS